MSGSYDEWVCGIGEKDPWWLSMQRTNFRLLSTYGRYFSHVLYHLVLTTVLGTKFSCPHFTDVQ